MVVHASESPWSSFQGFMPESNLEEIREALQKDWVLGDERFKRKIAEKTGICRDKHGGDRKSLVFSKNQVLCPLDW